MVQNELTVHHKPLKAILENSSYTVAYYQREYVWEESHIEKLLNDFLEVFNREYASYAASPLGKSSERGAKPVADFESYFLSTFVVHETDNQESQLVDGQQRLTSLSIIFRYLWERLSNDKTGHITSENIAHAKAMYFSAGLYDDDFKLAIDTPTVETGFKLIDNYVDNTLNDGEHENRILKRYQDVEALLKNEFPSDDPKRLRFFLYWLRQRVLMIEIISPSSTTAYTVFEAMNDRGLNLTSYELLKGFLLDKINDPKERETYAQTWQSIMTTILNVKRKNSRAEQASGVAAVDKFFSAFLQSRYSDFDPSHNLAKNSNDMRDLTQYYKWIRTPGHEEITKITDSNGAKQFIETLQVYAKWFETLYNGDTRFDKDNALRRMSTVDDLKGTTSPLTYILSALFTVIDPSLSDEENTLRIKLVGQWFEIMRARHFWSQTTLQGGHTSNLVAILKDRQTNEIALLLHKMIKKDEQDAFDPLRPPTFKTGAKSRKGLRYLLLRIHDVFDKTAEKPQTYLGERLTSLPPDIEHVLGEDEHGLHKSFFATIDEYKEYRDHIGGLLVLSATSNRSLQNETVEEKLRTYRAVGGVFAALLYLKDDTKTVDIIEHLPKLKTLLKTCHLSPLSFGSSPKDQVNTFGKETILARNEMYSTILKHTFNSQWFIEQTDSSLDQLEKTYAVTLHRYANFLRS